MAAFCMFITGLSFAQMPSARIVDTTHKKVRDGLITSLLVEGRFSHHTSKGKVYILPDDNMPCLVPDMEQTAKMPGSTQPMPENRMPNVIPPRRLIPKENK